DENGKKSGRRIPHGALSEGDLRDTVARQGPASHNYPPNTGNAWARSFLESVLPIPESEFRLCAECYLVELAPLFGELKRILQPQGLYRIHGENNYRCAPFDTMLRDELVAYRHLLTVMSRRCHDMGVTVDVDAWKRNIWCFRLQQATQEIAAAVPPGSSF